MIGLTKQEKNNEGLIRSFQEHPAIIEQLETHKKNMRIKYRLEGAKIRAKRKNADIPLCEDEKKRIKLFYAGCPEGHEVDHIIPVSKGGKHCMENLQYLTKLENRRKSDKLDYVRL